MDRSHFSSSDLPRGNTLAEDIALVVDSPVMSGLLQAMGGMLAILNERQQVLAVNDALRATLGIRDPKEVLGLRPGAALQCIQAGEGGRGCGRAERCPTCGALLAILASLDHNRPAERICALTAERKGATVDLALLVRSQPITLENRRLLLLILQDVTVQEQRAALERTFFHDLNNLFCGMVGVSEMLANQKNPEKLASLLFQNSYRLSREVEIQKCLASEGIRYNLVREAVGVDQIRENLQAFFLNHPVRRHKRLEFVPPAAEAEINTDLPLLLRTLQYMIVNALEATTEGDLVQIRMDRAENLLTISVWNRQPIPEEVVPRIFQRYFSTKQGEGRGLGTYAMKLFGEKFLGGQVDFSTSAEGGTLFKLVLPLVYAGRVPATG